MDNRTSSDATPHDLPSDRGRANGKTAGEGDEHFDWSTLVPLLVHPTKVAIIEALAWVEEPASPTDLTRMFGEGERKDQYLSLIAYHAAKLQEIGVIEVVRTRPVRGALEKFYALTSQP